MANPTLVLLLTDDPLAALFTVSGLEGYGYRVILAENAAKASELLKAARNVGVLVADADLSNAMGVVKSAREADPSMTVIYTAAVPGKIPDAVKVRGAPVLRSPYHAHQLVSVIGALHRRTSGDLEGEAA